MEVPDFFHERQGQFLTMFFRLSGMKCAILENLSTMTHMFVYPSDFGNLTMKSWDIAVHGRIETSKGSRCNGSTMQRGEL